jgi:hypothetical protein
MELLNKPGLTVWIGERRQGKTYQLCRNAVLNCIKNDSNSLLVSESNFSRVTSYCLEGFLKNENIEYKLNKTDRCYTFSNGSKLYIRTPTSPEWFRGTTWGFIGIDEAKDIKDLDYLVKSILYPTIVTKNGTIVLASLFDHFKQSNFNGFVLDAAAGNKLINTINN